MKIIFYGGSLNRSGGTERVSSLIASGLAKRGYQIQMISDQAGDKPFFDLDSSISVTSLFQTTGRNLIRTPLRIARLRRLLLKEKPDVLVSVESMLALFSVPATIGLPIRHICWEHFHFNNDLGRKGRRVARQLAARFCDDIVTLTDRDKLSWQQGVKLKAKIQSIPNPCPYPVQVAHSIPEDSRLVLAVGRLVPEKGHNLLLEAWKSVILAEPTWRLRIVGSGTDEKYLKQLCSTFGLSNSVVFHPNTPDIEVHYKEAAIFCLSSKFEGFPMILLEAIAFGVPVVSFDCNNGPAEILEGTGAKLVTPGDVDALADALLAYMKNPQSRVAVSKAEKLRAEAFQLDKIVDQWVELLERPVKTAVTVVSFAISDVKL